MMTQHPRFAELEDLRKSINLMNEAYAKLNWCAFNIAPLDTYRLIKDKKIAE
jgi:hypothetical protein